MKLYKCTYVTTFNSDKTGLMSRRFLKIDIKLKSNSVYNTGDSDTLHRLCLIYLYGKRLACIEKTAYLSFSYAFSKIWIYILYYRTYYHDKDSLLLGYMTDPWLNSTASVSITRSSCVYNLKRSTTIPRQATNQSIGDYRAQSNSHSHSEWNEVSNFDKLRANCNK